MTRVAAVALFAAVFAVFWARADATPELVVYTYDSFVARGGLGPAVIPLFERRCGCKVRALGSGDAGQLVTRLQIDAERGAPGADVVVGIDQQLWPKARALVEPWGKWRPKGYDRLAVRVEEGFLPFDYGVLAFIANRALIKGAPPGSLKDLLKPEWKRNLILEDPRTSTPGLGLLLYTASALGEGAWDFWHGLRSQWLTLAPGWDAAYGIFMKNEAPLVWSYTTSQAYHEEHGQKGYEAVLFAEGQPVQIEGAALVRGASPARREWARQFLEFLISEEAQELVPKKNWMLPALRGVKLPASFQKLPKPKRLWNEKPARDVAAALDRWGAAIR